MRLRSARQTDRKKKETSTYLPMVCVSLKVTLGPKSPTLTRKEADREGPDLGELS